MTGNVSFKLHVKITKDVINVDVTPENVFKEVFRFGAFHRLPPTTNNPSFINSIVFFKTGQTVYN